VHLSEASRELGGRVSLEARLPGLAEWARVRDWRVGQIDKLATVAVYRDSPLSAQDVLDFGADHVVLATGCHWRRDGYGRSNGIAIAGFDHAQLFTPDDLMSGAFAARAPAGPVLLFDDDCFYLGSVIAERLRLDGREVVYVTPDDTVASWSANTLDYRHIQRRLHELGVQQRVAHNLAGFDGARAELVHGWSGATTTLDCAAIVTLTARLPNEALALELRAREAEWPGAGIASVRSIGDCDAPGLIAHAVYAGHRYARELDEPSRGEVPFRRHLHVTLTD
jgi:dimethylamine/trimethylamine dehydrogenase